MPEPELLEHAEQRDFGLTHDRRQVGAAAELEVDRRAAEDREPGEADAAGDQQHTDNELADRPSLGDASDEGAPKGAQEIHHAQ